MIAQAPLVGPGSSTARPSTRVTWSSRENGQVVDVDAEKIVVETKDGGTRTR
jgi:hypothetical protein